MEWRWFCSVCWVTLVTLRLLIAFWWTSLDLHGLHFDVHTYCTEAFYFFKPSHLFHQMIFSGAPIFGQCLIILLELEKVVSEDFLVQVTPWHYHSFSFLLRLCLFSLASKLFSNFLSFWIFYSILFSANGRASFSFRPFLNFFQEIFLNIHCPMENSLVSCRARHASWFTDPKNDGCEDTK